MILHEIRLPADDSQSIMPYWLFLKKQQNLKLSSAANYRWPFKGYVLLELAATRNMREQDKFAILTLGLTVILSSN